VTLFTLRVRNYKQIILIPAIILLGLMSMEHLVSFGEMTSPGKMAVVLLESQAIKSGSGPEHSPPLKENGIILSPQLYFPVLSFLNLSPHYTCLLHTHHPLTRLLYTNCTQPQPPAIPDTSTLHFNKNPPKHAQGPQNPTVPILLPPPIHLFSHLPLFSATFTNYSNFYIQPNNHYPPNSHCL
jgi:hypothetical protein